MTTDTKGERQKLFTYQSYRLLSRFSEIIPFSSVGPFASLASHIGTRVYPAKTRLVHKHLTRVLGHEPSPQQVRRAFECYVRYWLESMRLPVFPQEQLDSRIEVQGLDHITSAVETGNGVILALPHMGNWEVAGAWLARQGVVLNVVAEDLKPQKLQRWFADFRTSLGMRVLVNGPGIGAGILSALRRNEAVALLCDRDVNGTGADTEFFGEITKLPRGPSVLAVRSKAALLPVACYQQKGRWFVIVDAPIEMRSEDEDVRSATDRISEELVKRIERLIRRAPEQWHLFQPNWPSDQA